MVPSDFSFANDLKAATELATPRTLKLIVRSCGVFFCLALVWAHFAVLDEVTRAQSKVISLRQNQVIQSLEGGLLQEILVAEGQVVQQGEILMRIDDTVLGSQFGEARERRAALQARLARLEGEARWDAPSPLDFPPDLQAAYPAATASEKALHEARVRKLQQEMEILDQQVQQKNLEKDELEAQARRLLSSKPLLERELVIARKLYADRVVPEIEMLRLDRQAAELNGQINVNRAGIARAEGGIREANARKNGAVIAFRALAEEELTKTRSELAIIDESIRAAQDRVRRTELRSPVRGIVNRIQINTIGAVIQPALALMEIVPLDDSLLVEAQVRPQDIGFIRPAQRAIVKITAYDSAIFGSLHGQVERISADTLADQKGETFYRVIVKTDKKQLGNEANTLPIIPGMIAQVEILTGRKSVLSYLLRPARILRDEALTER